MSKEDLSMNLQFFADNSGGSEAEHTNNGEAGQGSEGSSLSGSSNSDGEQSGAAKYTQDDINRMLAEKDSEVTTKITSSLADSYATNLSATVKHEVARANMTADQKRADDAKQAKAHQAKVEAELESYKRRDAKRSAVATAQTALTSAGVPNAASVAAFVADSDSAVQASKTSALLDWFGNTAASIKKDALTPTKNPQDASNHVGADYSTKNIPKDPGEMSFTQYAAWKTVQAEQQRKH